MSNVEIVKLIVDGLWKDSGENLEEYISADAEIISPVKEYVEYGNSPLKNLKEVVRYWKSAFPDAKSEWTSVKENVGGSVVINWEAEGTHSGEDFMGVSAKNTQMIYSGKTTYSFKDNKLIRYVAEVDVDSIKNALQISSS